MRARDFPSATASLVLCVLLLAHAALARPSDPCGARPRRGDQCDFPTDFCTSCQQRNPRSIATETVDQTKIVLQHMDNYRKAFRCVDDAFTSESAYQTANSTVPAYWGSARGAPLEEVIRRLGELKHYVAGVNATNHYVKYALCDMRARIDATLNTLQNRTARPGTDNRIKEEFNLTDASTTQANRQRKVIFAIFDTLYKRLDFLFREDYAPRRAQNVTRATVPRFLHAARRATLDGVARCLGELRVYIRSVEATSEYDQYWLGDLLAQVDATLGALRPRAAEPRQHANSIAKEFSMPAANRSTRAVRQRQVILTIFNELHKRLDRILKDLSERANKTTRWLRQAQALPPLKHRHLTAKQYKCAFNTTTIANYAQCYHSLQQELRDYRDATADRSIQTKLRKLRHHVNKTVKKLDVYVPSARASPRHAKDQRRKTKKKNKLEEEQLVAYFYYRCKKLNDKFAKVLQEHLSRLSAVSQ